MRTFIKKSFIASLGIGLVLGTAVASGDGLSPEARAYAQLSFGGSSLAPRDLHYGLRIDHDSRFTDPSLPAMVQFDYTTRGLSDMRVNGLSALRSSYRLRQNDEVAEEMVDEPGFFEGIGNWFGGLFGGGSDDSAEEATAQAEEAPVEDVPTDGAFLGYNAIDWGLVAIGAVGLGFAATEVVNADDKPANAGGGGDGGDGGDGGGCTNPNPLPVPPDCLDPPALNGSFGGGISDARMDPAYREWLDGGTGQMGDLGGAD